MDEAKFFEQLDRELEKLEDAVSKIRKLMQRRIASQPDMFPQAEAPAKKPKVRGKRPIPVDWTPEPEQMEQLAKDFPNVDLKGEADAHRDYWIARGEQRADWSASFRNWVRLAATRYNGDARTARTAFANGAARDKVASVSHSNSERARDALDRLHQLGQGDKRN